ncbi:unnamed protein product [Cyprideis torosa]|uniref:Uncharacterized protein n=1 Tax=Cyprideis torosa TaxID=163714 RepID=A0A7R8ZK73_9CRUS|nr:unnamed protein product [Cyprideis torosa]CAG0879649.1 unnamed protein product [Cyprideis torosa]
MGHKNVDTGVRVLWLATPVTATLSLVTVTVAMATNQWLHSEELMENPEYNGTVGPEYISKFTVSGLWNLCQTNHLFCSGKATRERRFDASSQTPPGKEMPWPGAETSPSAHGVWNPFKQNTKDIFSVLVKRQGNDASTPPVRRLLVKRCLGLALKLRLPPM